VTRATCTDALSYVNEIGNCRYPGQISKKGLIIEQLSIAEFMNTQLLKTAVRVWLMEILVSGFNFFVLMNLVYEPRWGELVAHQIGMSTRIVYIFIFAYFLLRFVKEYDTKDLIHVGIYG